LKNWITDHRPNEISVPIEVNTFEARMVGMMQHHLFLLGQLPAVTDYEEAWNKHMYSK